MAAEIGQPARFQSSSTREILVWDPFVRIGHWTLVLLFFVAYLTEDDLLTIHSWAGYGVGAYLVMRTVWGFVGSRHARFADFACGPAEAARYLLKLILFRATRYLGHSPAGGIMVLTLLFFLAATTLTGVALLAMTENRGPLSPWLGPEAAVASGQANAGALPLAAPAYASGRDGERGDNGSADNDDEGSELLEEVHELFANTTLFLIIIHIAGVVLASTVHRENLVRAMITGRKQRHDGESSRV